MEIKEYITTQTYSSFAIRYLCITMHMFATNSSILLFVNVRQWYIPTVYVTYIFSPMLFYSTRIGIFAILYLRSVFSKYPHSIHDISAHCPYFPLSSNAILLSSSFYILLLSTSISFYLISLASMHQIVYLLLCACVYWDDCYGVVTSYTTSYDDLWHTCFGCNVAISHCVLVWV